MEACKICSAPCIGCGLDPHDPKCGVCDVIHPEWESQAIAAFAAGNRNMVHARAVTCPRCGRAVAQERLLPLAGPGG